VIDAAIEDPITIVIGDAVALILAAHHYFG
jgi:hypothetical protein